MKVCQYKTIITEKVKIKNTFSLKLNCLNKIQKMKCIQYKKRWNESFTTTGPQGWSLITSGMENKQNKNESYKKRKWRQNGNNSF